jgi:carbamoyl-phosphate synthase small subunit
MSGPERAWLVLEDGTAFSGLAAGARGTVFGEVVFNTAITGYQEVLTDPSYRGQIVCMTAPEMGNVGVNVDDDEASRIHVNGLIVREMSPFPSSWRAEMSMGEYLHDQGIVAIHGIDTRALTRVLRTTGAQRGVISSEPNVDPRDLAKRVQGSPHIDGQDLVGAVSTPSLYTWEEPSWVPPQERADAKPPPPIDLHVVAYDFGIKRNILRNLRDLGCRVTVLPASAPARDALALNADGFFLSNGPGDPATLGYAVDAAREIVESGRPLFGICLGHQILGQALGGKTYKLRFGHHGANHPVKDLSTGKVEITSQNHNYAVDLDSLKGKAILTHVNLNDNTVEGMRVEGKPVFSVQYHPEASPGPHDANYLFGRFVEMMRRR